VTNAPSASRIDCNALYSLANFNYLSAGEMRSMHTTNRTAARLQRFLERNDTLRPRFSSFKGKLAVLTHSPQRMIEPNAALRRLTGIGGQIAPLNPKDEPRKHHED
jgi:hypothetical protein